VLLLDGASLNRSRQAKRLLLFVSIEGGKLRNVSGFADQTTKGRPIVDASGLTLAGQRLSGTVHVRYRADEWTTPLVERGTTAAATYTIDCDLGKREVMGRYRGTYGAEWKMEGELMGALAD
jgi:hypothetical protein